MQLKKIFAAAVAGLVLMTGVASAAPNPARHFVHPAEQGRVYLEKKGFTNVEGGSATILHPWGCGKNDYARVYKATNPKNGRTEKEVVCFGMFLGPYQPLF